MPRFLFACLLAGLSSYSAAHVVQQPLQAQHFTQTPGWQAVLDAAQSGSGAMKYTIGKIYDEETLYPDSQQQALSWYESAASQGHLDAMIQTGIAYHLGFGTQVNEHRAWLWFKKAADFNHIEGYFYLAELYRHAQESELRDLALAKKNYETAVEHEHLAASMKLAELLLTEPQFQVQLQRIPVILRKSSQLENPEAHYLLGMYYSHPQSPEPNFRRAQAYFKLAAQANDHRAEYELLMGFPGDSLTDPVRAYNVINRY